MPEESRSWGEIVWRGQMAGFGLFTRLSFRRGAVIENFRARLLLSEPTPLTIQTGESEHMLMDPPHLEHINHSCDPNALVDTAQLRLIALREIGPGEEISFFYPSTEWSVAQPFLCLCGGSCCLRQVHGAVTLADTVLERHALSPHIRALMARRRGHVSSEPTSSTAEQTQGRPPQSGQP